MYVCIYIYIYVSLSFSVCVVSHNECLLSALTPWFLIQRLVMFAVIQEVIRSFGFVYMGLAFRSGWEAVKVLARASAKNAGFI